MMDQDDQQQEHEVFRNLIGLLEKEKDTYDLGRRLARSGEISLRELPSAVVLQLSSLIYYPSSSSSCSSSVILLRVAKLLLGCVEESLASSSPSSRGPRGSASQISHIFTQLMSKCRVEDVEDVIEIAWKCVSQCVSLEFCEGEVPSSIDSAALVCEFLTSTLWNPVFSRMEDPERVKRLSSRLVFDELVPRVLTPLNISLEEVLVRTGGSFLQQQQQQQHGDEEQDDEEFIINWFAESSDSTMDPVGDNDEEEDDDEDVAKRRREIKRMLSHPDVRLALAYACGVDEGGRFRARGATTTLLSPLSPSGKLAWFHKYSRTAMERAEESGVVVARRGFELLIVLFGRGGGGEGGWNLRELWGGENCAARLNELSFTITSSIVLCSFLQSLEMKHEVVETVIVRGLQPFDLRFELLKTVFERRIPRIPVLRSFVFDLIRGEVMRCLKREESSTEEERQRRREIVRTGLEMAVEALEWERFHEDFHTAMSAMILLKSAWKLAATTQDNGIVIANYDKLLERVRVISRFARERAEETEGESFNLRETGKREQDKETASRVELYAPMILFHAEELLRIVVVVEARASSGGA